MKLERILVENCRNIGRIELVPDSELTVISGCNGQGKTNLLECVWLLTGAKSFRAAKDMELVRRGEAVGRITGEVARQQAQQRIEIVIGGEGAPKRGRYAKINGVDYGRATAIAGNFTAVVFDPGHLGLVKGGPEGRRRFLDAALCQLYPGYLATYRRFSRALVQKNALLRQYYNTPDADFLLDTFDEEISACGEEITRRRGAYLAQAGAVAQETYREISRGAERLEIRFLPCCAAGGLAQLLRQARAVDIKAGFCTKGPQREDFEAMLDGESARVFGSQGQQRSVALSLKLAEAAVAKQVTGEHPVMLLDDVLSELDEGRQAYLLSRMHGKQSFVTTCDASAFGRTAGKIVEIEGGEIKE